MQKITRPQYGLEEQLLLTIYKLVEKKTSNMFREPVDVISLPDYPEKIKNPIDLSTISKKIKGGNYQYPRDIKADLDLMIQNCRSYNVQPEIIKRMEKFQKSIETEWGNFEKEIKRKSIRYDTPLIMNEELFQRLEAIEEKILNRKPSNLQINLIEADKRGVVPECRILPQLPRELICNDSNEKQVLEHLEYIPQAYLGIKQNERQSLLRMVLDHEDISAAFERASLRKLQKYKKILFRKIMWIEQKIIRKCLERKRFKKMLTPEHLASLTENGEIATNLQLRKLQMYVKQVAYWIEEYPQVLSYSMKQKFIDHCKVIRSCIFRVLRYKKIPRATKVQLEPTSGWDEPRMDMGEGEQEASKYENKMKEFRRMLNRDQGQTIKKYTKIIIRHQNSEFYVFDWNSQNSEKKQKSRNPGMSRALDNTEETQRIEKERERREERERDELFLSEYKKKSNVEIVLHYQQKLRIDWESVILDKCHRVMVDTNLA